MPESSIDSCRRMLIIGSNDLEQANYMGNEVTKKDLQALQKKVDDLNRFWDQSSKFDESVKTSLEGLKKSIDEINKFCDQSIKFDASIKKAVEELQKKCS